MATEVTERQAYYDVTLKAVVNFYPNFLTNEAFIQRSEYALQVLKQHGCGKLLVDTTHLGVMGLDKKQYVEQTWFPKAIGAGLNVVAFLVPKDTFGKYGMEQANKKAAEEMPIKLRYFEDLQQAKQWLRAE